MSNLKNVLNYLLNESGRVFDVGHRPLNDYIADLFFDRGYDSINYLSDAVDDGDRDNVLDSVQEVYKEFMLRDPEFQEDPLFLGFINSEDPDVKEEAFNTIADRLLDSNLQEGVEEEKGYRGPKKYKKVVGSGKHKRTVRYGAKGYSIAPGTSKGNSYCARSYGQMKDHPSAAKDPNSPLRLSRKKWRCSGKYSKK